MSLLRPTHGKWGRPAGPLDDPGRARRLVPPLVAVGVGLIAVVLVHEDSVDAETAAWVAAAGAILALALLYVPWERLPSGLQVVAPLASVAFLAVVRDVSGGPAAGVALLFLVPVIWSAQYGTLPETVVVLLAAVAALLVPIPLSDLYPEGEVSRAVILAVIAGLAAWIVQSGRRATKTDALTRIANRGAWDEALAREVARARRTGSHGVVALLDLDHFKQFNDANGHPAGDALLREAAAAWMETLRDYDLIARVGGEEFAALLPDTSLEEAMKVADRLRTLTPGGQTCSGGLAEITGADDPGSVMRAADDALYEAKRAGRDNIVCARPGGPSARGR